MLGVLQVEEIKKRYVYLDDIEPSHSRGYHDWDHVLDVLEALVSVSTLVSRESWNDLCLAALFHDVVYKPGASNNEIRSAELAKIVIGERSPETERLVMLTARKTGFRAQARSRWCIVS